MHCQEQGVHLFKAEGRSSLPAWQRQTPQSFKCRPRRGVLVSQSYLRGWGCRGGSCEQSCPVAGWAQPGARVKPDGLEMRIPEAREKGEASWGGSAASGGMASAVGRLGGSCPLQAGFCAPPGGSGGTVVMVRGSWGWGWEAIGDGWGGSASCRRAGAKPAAGLLGCGQPRLVVGWRTLQTDTGSVWV